MGKNKCIASCTAHIQELTDPEDCLRNIGTRFQQFCFMVGAPDKGAKFQSMLGKETKAYPTIFGFHGSPLQNWHSVGLLLLVCVYFSKDGDVSMRGYARTSSVFWENSMTWPVACCTLTEIINHPQQFVSQTPHYVVDKTDWIMCRYLLVICAEKTNADVGTSSTTTPPVVYNRQAPTLVPKLGKYLAQDPRGLVILDRLAVDVPQPSYHLDKPIAACVEGQKEITFDEEDRAVFDMIDDELPVLEMKSISISEMQMDVDMIFVTAPAQHPAPLEEWKPNDPWVKWNVEELLPPPTESLTSEKQFGNIGLWVVEIHSFDPEFPIAKDMKEKGVNLVVFEIWFPHTPPFFRIIRPCFQTFMQMVQGGGGHITVGGSICMDLLTVDGWLPSYSISAILLQIKLAISTMHSHPAQLQEGMWDRAYTPQEALHGYVQAAARHKWKIPDVGEMKRLVMQH
ncbi:hypothetical protein BS17DRAFT_768175 [Gyrodon lividus]|nr:hypothetical protein BS17DRAFT_768175 [Gyrodon lividus]